MFLKGLSEKVNSFETKDKFSLLEIDMELLEPPANNFYGIREIDELAASIKKQGLLHNLVIREKADGKYEILSGERRYHALKQLSINKVPCKVQRNLSDEDSEILLIEANARTRALTPTELMKGIERLEEIYKSKKANGEVIDGKTRDLIGKVVGKSGTHVGRLQKLNKKLIDELKNDLDEKKITIPQAKPTATRTKRNSKTNSKTRPKRVQRRNQYPHRRHKTAS